MNEYIVNAIDRRMASEKRPEPFAPPPGEWCEGCAKLGGLRPAIEVGRQQRKLGYDEGMRPWCFEHACELDAPGGKAQKCEECMKKPSEGA